MANKTLLFAVAAVADAAAAAEARSLLGGELPQSSCHESAYDTVDLTIDSMGERARLSTSAAQTKPPKHCSFYFSGTYI